MTDVNIALQAQPMTISVGGQPVDIAMPGALAASVATAAAAAAAASAAEAAASDEPLANHLKAAAGEGTVKLLVTANTPQTYKSGSDTLIERLDPLIVPEAGAYLGQGANTLNSSYAGPSPKPTHPTVSDGRLLFYSETGFTLKDSGGTEIGLIDYGTNWSRDVVLEFPAVAASFTLKADMDAAASTYSTGDIVRVTGDVTATMGGGWPEVPDPAYKVANIATGNITRGYYVKTYSGFEKLDMPLFTDEVTGGSHLGLFYMDMRGQFGHYAYDGVNQEAARFVDNLIEMGQAGPVHLHMSRNGSELILRVNGREYATTHVLADMVADYFCLNGRNRGSTNYQPFKGVTWLCHAFTSTQGCSYQEALAVSNVLARQYGLPERRESGVAYLVVNYDQSRTSGDDDASSTPVNPDPVSGWAFAVEGANGTDNLRRFPSQRQLPDTFCANAADPKKIGVFFPTFNGYGNGVSSESYQQATGGVAETIEGGLDAQLRLHMPSPTDPLYIMAITVGGAALSLLQEEDAGIYIHDLADPSKTPTKYRSRLYASVIRAARHARSRGWRLVPIAILNQQGETTSYTPADNPVIGDIHEADLRVVQDVVLAICGETDTPPLCMKKAISYSYDGDSNSYNEAAIYAPDNQFYRIQENRDLVFRYAMMPSTYGYMGRGIHWPYIVQRHLGMIYGDKIGRGYFKGEDVTPLDWTAQISGSSVVITFDRAVELVETNGPFVTGYGRVDGVGGTGYLNYGFVFDGAVSSRTQSADATFNAGARTLTIPLSGAPSAGDVVSATGLNALFTNIREAADIIGELPTQAWGSLPLADSSPATDFTADAHLEDWAVPKRVTLTGGIAR